MSAHYLTLEQILLIHFDQTKRYGGSHGVRDLSLLESAIQRPQASFMGKDLYPEIFDKAAALWHSLALNHPFLDGNKRTAVSCAVGFLYFNGYNLKVSQEELVRTALEVESKKINLAELAKWIKENSKKI